MTPDNSRPVATDDLETCLACGEPSKEWRSGPAGAAVGFCGAGVCEAEIAARAAAAPALRRGCRVCSAPGVHNMGGFLICDSQACADAVATPGATGATA